MLSSSCKLMNSLRDQLETEDGFKCKLESLAYCRVGFEWFDIVCHFIVFLVVVVVVFVFALRLFQLLETFQEAEMKVRCVWTDLAVGPGKKRKEEMERDETILLFLFVFWMFIVSSVLLLLLLILSRTNYDMRKYLCDEMWQLSIVYLFSHALIIMIWWWW